MPSNGIGFWRYTSKTTYKEKKLVQVSECEIWIEEYLFSKEDATQQDVFTKKLVNVQKIIFEKVSQKEIICKRREGISGIVMVNEGQLYFAPVTKKTKIPMSEQVMLHKCANCERISAQPDPFGCQKIRDLPIQGKRIKPDSMRIEKYPFVLYGLETVNTKEITTLIYECANYKKWHE